MDEAKKAELLATLDSLEARPGVEAASGGTRAVVAIPAWLTILVTILKEILNNLPLSPSPPPPA